MKHDKRKTRPTARLQPDLRPDFRGRHLDAVPDTWTDEQAIAVHDFCVVLQEIIWRRYTDALTDAALNAQLAAARASSVDDKTWPLPFGDEPEPF